MMTVDHVIHSLAEPASLKDKTYIFDRENATWSLPSLPRSVISFRSSSPAWLRHTRGIGYAAASWKEIRPLTVVQLSVTGDELGGERRVTFEELHDLFEKWQLTDDVWEKGFLEIIHLQPKPSHSGIIITITEDERRKLQTKYSNSHIFCGHAIPIRGYKIRDELHPLGKAAGRKDAEGGGTSNILLPGPYFASIMDGRLMPAYRVYEDTYETFIQSSQYPPNGKDLPLPTDARKSSHLNVAVPSRIASQSRTRERPLAGLRFSVKDIFYITGLGPPGLGSREWVSLRDKQNLERRQDQDQQSIHGVEGVVEVLERMGAVLVGKNKLSQFAFAGPYHWQNTDYLLNFNPRADGLQTPSDSSGGSASAVAAYDWLDFSIGTDTGGSVRFPADVNGVYGGRPTTGAIDTSRMQPLAKSLDTTGVLARDPLVYCDVVRALLKYPTTPVDNPLPPPLPVRLKILVDKGYDREIGDANLGGITTMLSRFKKWISNMPCSLSGASPPPLEKIESTASSSPILTNSSVTITADGVIGNFILKLENLLGVQREYVVLDDLWEKTKEEFGNTQQWPGTGKLLGRIGDEFGDLYRKIVYWESYQDLGEPFMKAYSKANDGRLPLVNNNAKAAWKTIEAGEICEPMYKEALIKKQMLKSWVDTYLFEGGKSGYRTLLVSRGSSKGEDLRDTPPDERYFAPSQPGCILHYAHMSTLADFPDYRVPVGQFESLSSVTGHVETYPLTASLSFASGCDRDLIDLIERLHLSGDLKMVKTGRTAF